MAKRNAPSTWSVYLQSLNRGVHDMSGLLDHHAAQFLNTQSIYPAFFHSVPLMYLLDYTTGRYLIMSNEAKQVMGLDPGGFMEGGIAYMVEHYHPDHFKLFNNKIFDTRLNFLKSIRPEEHANYIFTYNHRFKDTKGRYADYLQRNCFIKSDAAGNPLVSFGMIINYNHFGTQAKVVHTIEKLFTSESGTYAELVDKKLFLLHMEDEELFSRREKEVLLWLAEGLTSKEIADKLHVSEHTIINHKRHMQEKSNSPNTVALVSFALRKGII